MHADVHGIAAMLARRVGHSADSDKVAAVALSIWHEVDEALSPIIGNAGVTALYKRSLYTTIPDHPCLVTAYESVARNGTGFTGLDTALLQQTPGRAVAALSALLLTFHELLTFLIGGSLLERLLRSVWDKPSGNDATKEFE